MTIERKLIGTTDAATSSAGYVEDVFSTWLYPGNGSTQTITNGIDLATNGGMVWTQARSGVNAASGYNLIHDTARGTNNWLNTTTTEAQGGNANMITAFNSNGYNLGNFSFTNGGSTNYVSWTFRKQPKFFDILTFTAGQGDAGALPHNLGVVPGMVIIKQLNGSSFWETKHLGISGNIDSGYIRLNSSSAANSYAYGTSTSSTVDITAFVTSGNTYIVYLFAHDPTANGLIQCGSYTGNGSASGPTVTLGWEPQFVMIKNASSTGDWNIFDNMRGIATGGNDPYLFANTSAAEATTNGDLIDLTPTGFVIKNTSSQVNTSSNNYIYLAIRRGPMRTPTDATKVFEPTTQNIGNSYLYSIGGANGTPIDMALFKSQSSSDNRLITRLIGDGRYLNTTSTSAEITGQTNPQWSSAPFTNYPGMVIVSGDSSSYAIYKFRRAPGFFDAVCYSGNVNSNVSVNHSLGVAPEMVIMKQRDGVRDWLTWHYAAPSNSYAINRTDGPFSNQFNSSPTSTQVVLNAFSGANQSGNYVMYLFATCPGVSKVGSYTGNGSSQTIDCGFASGARFVLIKRTDSTGDWWVYDSARGIVAANDPALRLNSTAAEVTSADAVDPQNSGFIVNQEATCNINVSSATYIYLAIA